MFLGSGVSLFGGHIDSLREHAGDSSATFGMVLLGLVVMCEFREGAERLWEENRTDPARNGMMRVKDQATLLIGQVLTFEEFLKCSEMLISKHAN